MSNFNSLFLQSRYHRWLKRVVAEPGSKHAAGSSVAASTELGRACSDALETWTFHCCRQPKHAAGSSVAATTELGRACSDAL